MKKALSVFLISIISLLSFAQSEGWYKYPVFVDDVTDIVEAGNKVYYLSGGNLFSYSPDSEESYYYSTTNKLTDVDIASIHYNYDKKYLLIVYSNANIDVLYDNGKVVNMPDIRDAQVASNTVNDVVFGTDRIAVATEFGIVIFDDNRMEVKESGIYNTPILGIGLSDENIFITYRTDDAKRIMCYSPINQRHNSLEKFTSLGNADYDRIVVLDNNLLLLRARYDKKLYLRKVNYSNNSLEYTKIDEFFVRQPIRKYKNGYYTATADGLVLINGQDAKLVALPADLNQQQIAINSNENQLWAGDANGIARYQIDGDKATVLNNKLLHDGALTCQKVGYLKWSNDGERLYVSNLLMSQYKAIATGEWTANYQTTNIIEDGDPHDVSLLNASADFEMSQKHQTNTGNLRMYGDPAWMAEDPDDPDTYYIANSHEGVYVCRRNSQTGEYEEVGKYTLGNSPIPETWGVRAQALDFDSEGNLWVAYQSGAQLSVLPAAKRKLNPADVKPTDWKEVTKLANYNVSHKDMQVLVCKKSNMIFLFSALYGSGFVVIDTKGTYTNTNDDTVYMWSIFTDQDGNVFEAAPRTTFAIEDTRGAVWIGTSNGVFEITNPAEATNPNMTVRRIKVPRNDGTNYADYLLESDMINWISLDPAGRKWIATESSGIFLVSALGDEIIKNYNKDNSPLTSNYVSCIEADPLSNTVYAGTPNGLYSFASDASPAQETFDELIAYPNPVRPEFTGDVKITGLMDDSIVKVCDVSGSVIYQTRSEGGMASWNVCNYAGERVRSGVYYIYATANNGSAKGAFTKILVIN